MKDLFATVDCEKALKRQQMRKSRGKAKVVDLSLRYKLVVKCTPPNPADHPTGAEDTELPDIGVVANTQIRSINPVFPTTPVLDMNEEEVSEGTEKTAWMFRLSIRNLC
ncbi:hypothetical protein ACOSQ3_004787 [Xanthoceras sorbifolium]